jgi:small subunit ribosomal protein S20
LPQRKASVKDLKQNYRRKMHNMDIRTDLKKTIKDFMASVEAKNKKDAETNLRVLYKKIDKAAKKKVLKDNTASRRKSRFSRLLASIA